jgi:signal transduction histidine kinase
MAWLSLGVFGRIVLPVGYAIPVVIAGLTRSRRLLWGVVTAFAVLTMVKFGVMLNRTDPNAVAEHTWSGAAVLVDLFLTGLVVDLLFRSQAKLAQSLAAQTAASAAKQELDARRRDAEEASMRKTRFLAALSHDIRTPANAIGLMAELIKRTSADPQAAQEIPQLAEELQTSSLGLVNLVGDVLDLTRLDSGAVELNPVKFDLGQWLLEECAKLQPLVEEKQLQFECRPPPSVLCVRCDRIKLGRVLTNLVGNAIKFTERGQVHVTAQRADDGSVRISVQDTGIGIAQEHQGHIFDEFFQIRNPDRDRNQGTGLGLSISKRLLDVMGGRLSVESAPGRGSTFTITLPASAVVG